MGGVPVTRRNLLHKWSVYALGLLLVWVLDAYILPRYPVFGISPMLLPLAAAAVAVLEGAHAGAGFGMGVGLLWALAYPGGYGSRVFLLSLMGMASGALCQYALSQSLAGCMLCAAGVVALLDLQQIFRLLLADLADLPALLQVAAPEWLLTMLWTPVIYVIFRAIFRRVGGTKLA